MEAETSIKTDTPSPVKAAVHHMAKGAFATVSGVALAAVGLAAVGVGVAYAALYKVSNKTEIYAGDIPPNMSRFFNVAGGLLTVAIPVALASTLYFSFPHAEDNKSPSGVVNPNCTFKQLPKTVNGERVYSLPNGCPSP